MLKRFFNQKNWAILLAVVAVLTLLLLAAGLGDIHFQPARPIGRAESTAIQFSVDKIAEAIDGISFWKQVVFWVLVFVFVLIVASLFSPELRKRIIRYFLRFALFALVLFYIVKNYRWLFPALNLSQMLLPDTGAPSGGKNPPAVFSPPQVSSVLLYTISLLVILVLAVIAFLVARWWLHNQALQKSSRSLEDLAEIARASLAELSAGRAWEDAIIQCYARMLDVLAEKRGLHRRTDLTASEFAARLEEAGLPGEAIQRLTHLFEAARYGLKNASPMELSEAVACLTTVLHACGVKE
jgi:ABC-type multidrug transport system fused ATPase/permease subunit